MTSNSWENRISASISTSSQTINERIKIRTFESMQDLKDHLLYSLSEKTTEGYSPRKQEAKWVREKRSQHESRQADPLGRAAGRVAELLQQVGGTAGQRVKEHSASRENCSRKEV